MAWIDNGQTGIIPKHNDEKEIGHCISKRCLLSFSLSLFFAYFPWAIHIEIHARHVSKYIDLLLVSCITYTQVHLLPFSPLLLSQRRLWPCTATWSVWQWRRIRASHRHQRRHVVYCRTRSWHPTSNQCGSGHSGTRTSVAVGLHEYWPMIVRVVVVQTDSIRHAPKSVSWNVGVNSDNDMENIWFNWPRVRLLGLCVPPELSR